MSKPTDIEVLSGILADFPTDAATLRNVQNRLAQLLVRLDRVADKTIDESMRERLKILNNSLIDMWWIVDCLEGEKSPWYFRTSHPPYDDDIPF